jgi:hypothetical protein
MYFSAEPGETRTRRSSFERVFSAPVPSSAIESHLCRLFEYFRRPKEASTTAATHMAPKNVLEHELDTARREFDLSAILDSEEA